MIAGEPGSLHVSHVSSINATGVPFAQSIFHTFVDSQPGGKLPIIGSDGSASITGTRSHFLFGKVVAKTTTARNMFCCNAMNSIGGTSSKLWITQQKVLFVGCYWQEIRWKCCRVG